MEMAFTRNKSLINCTAVFLLFAFSLTTTTQGSSSPEDGFPLKFKIHCLADTDYATFLIRSAKENTQFNHKVNVTTNVADKWFS
jgi:hypothetical protein